MAVGKSLSTFARFNIPNLGGGVASTRYEGLLIRRKSYARKGNLEKRAIITLKEGYTLDLFGHGRAGAATVEPQVETEKKS